jgi:hypothetical protein
MTGDVLNLRQFRKQKARADKEKAADQNRISFGRTKAEKTLTQRLNEQADRRLDQGQRDVTSKSEAASPEEPATTTSSDRGHDA